MLKDLARLRDGLVAARLEGTERLPTGSSHAGARFRTYEIGGGRLTRSDVFGYRKDLLAHHDVTPEQAHGALRVMDDDDQRLYHLQPTGQDYEWRRYRQAGYVSTGASLEQWLCHECLDEIRDHFAIRVSGGPLEGRDEN